MVLASLVLFEFRMQHYKMKWVFVSVLTMKNGNFFVFMLLVRFVDVVIVSSRDSLDRLFWLAFIDV